MRPRERIALRWVRIWSASQVRVRVDSGMLPTYVSNEASGDERGSWSICSFPEASSYRKVAAARRALTCSIKLEKVQCLDIKGASSADFTPVEL